MKPRLRRLLWLVPVIFLVSVLALGALADWWLESSGGRTLLEQELSNSLGLPVRLAGEFHFTPLPRLKVSGRGLRIGQPHGAADLAGCEQYSAAVEFLPFLQGELRIASIELGQGFVELASWPSGDEGQSAPGGRVAFELPRVAALQVDDFSIRLADSGSSLLLEQLRLEDFQPGKPAWFELRAQVVSGPDTRIKIESGGRVQLSHASQSLQITMQALAINWMDTRFENLAGELSLDWSMGRVNVQLAAPQGSAHPFDLGLDLSLGSAPAGELHGRYFLPEPSAPVDLGLRFTGNSDRVDLQQLDLRWEGQGIAGHGCVLMGDPGELHLWLESDRLDLDRIRAIMPAGPGDDQDFPLDLSAVLQVAEARLSGAVASGVTVEMGGTPDCLSAPARSHP